jgi:hypothetical protein
MKTLSVILFLCLFACKKQTADGQPFMAPVSSLITAAPSEISGITDSKINPGFLWAHEDGGNAAQLFLISHNGAVQKSIPIKGATNRDWEDMWLSGNHIYLGDIGDNGMSMSDYFIYRFAEPSAGTDTIRQVETIRFQYADGAHDAEAFWVDFLTKDVFIITKRDAVAEIYKLSSPSVSIMNTATLAGSLSYTGVVGLAISPDGKEVIVKTYAALHYYKVNTGQSILQALTTNSYQTVPYQQEPQGEAVCFANSNNGFFTLSEKGFSNEVRLYFYKRK